MSRQANNNTVFSPESSPISSSPTGRRRVLVNRASTKSSKLKDDTTSKPSNDDTENADIFSPTRHSPSKKRKSSDDGFSWVYLRKYCTSCAKLTYYFEQNGVSAEDQNRRYASDSRIDGKEALKLARSAKIIYVVVPGNKIEQLDPTNTSNDHFKSIIGRSGDLRAPSFLYNSTTLVVGFHEQLNNHVLFGDDLPTLGTVNKSASRTKLSSPAKSTAKTTKKTDVDDDEHDDEHDDQDDEASSSASKKKKSTTKTTTKKSTSTKSAAKKAKVATHDDDDQSSTKKSSSRKAKKQQPDDDSVQKTKSAKSKSSANAKKGARAKKTA